MRGSQVGQVVSPSLLNFVNLLLRHVCVYGVRDVSRGCVVYGDVRSWEWCVMVVFVVVIGMEGKCEEMGDEKLHQKGVGGRG